MTAEEIPVGPGDWFGLVGAIMGIAVILGAAVVVFKGSYSTARLDALRKDLDDSDRRWELAERDISSLRAELASVKNENELLRGLVTQRAEVAELGVLLSDHHRESGTAWATLADAITGLQVVVERLDGHITERGADA